MDFLMKFLQLPNGRKPKNCIFHLHEKCRLDSFFFYFLEGKKGILDGNSFLFLRGPKRDPYLLLAHVDLQRLVFGGAGGPHMAGQPV